jgi:hypothetical protein
MWRRRARSSLQLDNRGKGQHPNIGEASLFVLARRCPPSEDASNPIQSALLVAASRANTAFFVNHSLVADEVGAAA